MNQLNNQFNIESMKAILEKINITDKIIGDIKCGTTTVKDCIGIDKRTYIIKFLSIPIYKRVDTFNEFEGETKQNHTSSK